MAKESGIGATATVDDSAGCAQAITNDVTNFDISVPVNMQDITGLDKSAVERLQLLADGNVNLNGLFNDAACTGAHTVLNTIPTSSQVRTVAIAISCQTLSQEMFGTDYRLTRGADGSFVWAVPFVLQDGTVPNWCP